MAIETITILKDDLTGQPGEDVQTVSFGYKGTTYELELSDESEKELAALLDPYVKVARRVQSQTRSAASRGTVDTQARENSRAARAWAQGAGEKTVKDAGLKVPGDRGRVDGRIVELWEKAGKPSA